MKKLLKLVRIIRIVELYMMHPFMSDAKNINGVSEKTINTSRINNLKSLIN